MFKRFFLSAAVILGTTAFTTAWAEPSQPPDGLRFKTFIQAVLDSNIGLAAQKYNVDIADAAIAVAAIAPDPTVSFGYSSYELSQIKMPRGTMISVNYTLENAAKREARTQVAQEDKSLAEAQLKEYMKILIVDAANIFIDSLRFHTILERRKATLEIFQKLARNDAEKSKKPEFSTAERAQLRLELARLKAEVYQGESDAAVADQNLAFYLGQSQLNKPRIFAQGSLEQPLIHFDESQSLASALEQRPDILSMERALAAARARSKLAQKNRNLDLGFTVGVTHTEAMWSIPDAGGTYSSGSYPMTNSLMALVTMPIPLSLINQDGDLRGPAAAAVQAELRVSDLRSKVSIEVRQAILKYQLALRQLEAYREGKADADLILRDTLEKFRLGHAGFPDIVYYTRTANEMIFAHIDAQAAAAKALLSVQQASGDWKFEQFEH